MLPVLNPINVVGLCEGFLSFVHSEISEITSVKKEDVISTLQYLNLINYYKVIIQKKKTKKTLSIASVDLLIMSKICSCNKNHNKKALYFKLKYFTVI